MDAEHIERHCLVAICSQEKSSGVYVRCSCGATFPSSSTVASVFSGESFGIRAQREHAEHAKQAKDVERDERRARYLSKLCEEIDHQPDGSCVTDSNAIEKLRKMLVSVARELILRERVTAVPALNASLLRAFHIVSGREGFLRDASDRQQVLQVLQVIGCLPTTSSQCPNLCVVSAASTTKGDDDGIALVSDIPANEEKEDEHALLKDTLMKLKNQ